MLNYSILFFNPSYVFISSLNSIVLFNPVLYLPISSFTFSRSYVHLCQIYFYIYIMLSL